MRTNKKVLALTLGVLVLAAVPAQAVGPYVAGTYVATARQGTIQFTPVKRVIQFGYQGNFRIDGRTYPGSYYTIRGTPNIGMVWYYGSSGLSAGSAVVAPVGGTTYAGTITFTNRQGQVTDAGTVTVDITVR